MGRRTTRREWLAHCSLLGLGLCGAGALAAAAKAPATVLVLGDSLSAEYGIARGSGWVALLEQRLAREKIAATVVNASVSGDTTSGGRSRLAALLALGASLIAWLLGHLLFQRLSPHFEEAL